MRGIYKLIFRLALMGLVSASLLGCSDPGPVAETDKIIKHVKRQYLSDQSYWLEQYAWGKWAAVVLFVGFGDNLDACKEVETTFSTEGGLYRCTRADRAIPAHDQ